MIVLFLLLFSPLVFSLQIEVNLKDIPFPFLLAQEIDYKVKGLKVSEELWLIEIWQDLRYSPSNVNYLKVLKETKKVKRFLEYNPFISSQNFDDILKERKGNCISFVSYLNKILKDLGFIVEEIHGVVFSVKRNSPFYLSNIKATPHRWLKVFFPELGWISFDPLSESGRITQYHLPLKDGKILPTLKDLKIEVKKWD